MGRPIHPRNFGDTKVFGDRQLRLTQAWIPGEGSANTTSIIVSQVGTSRYVAKNTATGNTGVVTLASSVAAEGDAKIDVRTTGPGTPAVMTALMGVEAVEIIAAGTGYAVNDTIAVTGGTSSQAIVLTVSSVTSGAVTGLTITTAGKYSALISGTAATTTSGSGTGLTVRINKWKITDTAQSGAGSSQQAVFVRVDSSNGVGEGGVITATISSGAVNARTVVDGGTGFTAIPTLTVLPVSSTVQTAKKVTAFQVITHDGNIYSWTRGQTLADATYALLPLS